MTTLLYSLSAVGALLGVFRVRPSPAEISRWEDDGGQ